MYVKITYSTVAKCIQALSICFLSRATSTARSLSSLASSALISSILRASAAVFWELKKNNTIFK